MKLKYFVLCAIAFALLVPAVSVGATGTKVVDIQKQVSYEGSSLTSNEAANRGLTCIQKADGSLVCFASKEEAVASETAASEAAKADPGNHGVAGISRKRNSRGRTADVACQYPSTAMSIAQHSNFNNNSTIPGWEIIGYARQNWYNMTGAYANSATSLSAGNHTGYLADYTGGGGPRLNIGIGVCYSNMTNQGFNDRAQSRYRN